MPSVVIRSGYKVYNGEKGDGGNEELYKEVRQVDGLGQRIFEEAEQYYEMAAVEL